MFKFAVHLANTGQIRNVIGWLLSLFFLLKYQMYYFNRSWIRGSDFQIYSFFSKFEPFPADAVPYNGWPPFPHNCIARYMKRPHSTKTQLHICRTYSLLRPDITTQDYGDDSMTFAIMWHERVLFGGQWPGLCKYSSYDIEVLLYLSFSESFDQNIYFPNT